MDWIVERGAIPVPDGVLPEEAAFVEPVNTCLKAVRKAGVEKGQTVLVVGQGPIGLLLMQLCRWAGADVIASDTLPDRLEMAARLGAAVALDARRVDVPARGPGPHRGPRAPTWPSWPPSARPLSPRPLTRRGPEAVSSCSPPHPLERRSEIDLGALSAAEKEILTSYSASVDVQDLAAQLVFGREVRVRELVTHRFPLEDAPRAVELASGPRRACSRSCCRQVRRGHGLAR